MVMEEKTMVKKEEKRNSFIILALTLLLTGCGNSNLDITKNDILEVARDDANATKKKECSNVFTVFLGIIFCLSLQVLIQDTHINGICKL